MEKRSREVEVGETGCPSCNRSGLFEGLFDSCAGVLAERFTGVVAEIPDRSPQKLDLPDTPSACCAIEVMQSDGPPLGSRQVTVHGFAIKSDDLLASGIEQAECLA